MNHFTFSAVLVFFASFLAGIFFIFKSPSPQRSPSGKGKGESFRYFGFFWLTVAFWTLFVGFQFPILNLISGNAWGWWLHIGCMLVPVVYYHFVLKWKENLVGRGEATSPLLLAGYGLFFLFLLLNSVTDLFTGEIILRAYYHYPKPAVLYPLFIAYFQFYGILSTWRIFEFRKKIPAQSRKYLYLFLTVHLLAYAGAMDNYLIMYDQLIFPLYPYGLYLVLPYILIGSWSFSKLQK